MAQREGALSNQAYLYAGKNSSYRQSELILQLMKYNSPEEFIADLKIIDASLRIHYADYVADKYIRS